MIFFFQDALINRKIKGLSLLINLMPHCWLKVFKNVKKYVLTYKFFLLVLWKHSLDKCIFKQCLTVWRTSLRKYILQCNSFPQKIEYTIFFRIFKHILFSKVVILQFSSELVSLIHGLELFIKECFEISMEKTNKKNVSRAAPKVCSHCCDLLAQRALPLIPLLHETFIQLSVCFFALIQMFCLSK